MKSFNPYLVEEIVTQFGRRSNLFGLIDDSKSNEAELHGYEVTLSGKLVLPELTTQPEREERKLIQAILC
ncbi:MAG TPA: hypothetical protein PLD20_22175 [Blastocatellia bacterium]|nr:hypothetical protein [Blastocatellia bacterium]HMV83095.1 hypothetical protein [Blastocatellia bacterium]HMX26616.1 hypothetical protein [Blastocatellia bacterium]HMY70833.1 hypothetical protein [Blastocatellia bacterium]HMZ20661.1 hypothetical protein [Blastocatellia bacterium]